MIRLIAEPADALVDRSVRVSVAGDVPSEPLAIRATLERDDGARWVSEAPLADLASDSLRWAWSMSQAVPPREARDPFAPPAPERVTLECLASGRTVATAELLRRFCWTWRGEPLPYTPVDRSRNRFVAGQPFSIRPGYESTLDDPERVRVTA